MHSYVGLAFSYLGMAIKQEAMMNVARDMAEAAQEKRYQACGAKLAADGEHGHCVCGNHTLHEYGDGNGEVFRWR